MRPALKPHWSADGDSKSCGVCAHFTRVPKPHIASVMSEKRAKYSTFYLFTDILQDEGDGKYG